MAPIIFTARGLDLDTRLWVLGREYHVHSTILKLKSEFFFKFMDSPDKIPTSNPHDGFKYEWISRVDEDYDPKGENSADILSWQLIAKGVDEMAETKKLSLRERCREFQGFSNLLHAMYGQPYDVVGRDGLATIIKLADYYLALPVVSHTLSAALTSPFSNLSLLSVEIPEYAYKLRHHALLHDYVVHFAGAVQHCKWMHGVENENWEEAPDEGNNCPIRKAYMKLDPNIKILIKSAIKSIDRKIDMAYEAWEDYRRCFPPAENTETAIDSMTDLHYSAEDSRFPGFYRDIQRDCAPYYYINVINGGDESNSGRNTVHHNRPHPRLSYLYNRARELLNSNLKLRTSLFSYPEMRVVPNDVFLSSDTETDLSWHPEYVGWDRAKDW